jgi:PAS domain S-box-containing protein
VSPSAPEPSRPVSPRPRETAAATPAPKRAPWSRWPTRDSDFWGGHLGQVVAGFTLFLLGLLWTALIYQLELDRANVLSAARVNTENLVRAYAEHVAAALAPLDQTILRIKQRFEQNPRVPDFAALMRDTPAPASGALVAGIIDASGHLVATNVTLRQSKPDVSDRDYFRAHIADDHGALDISQPIVGRYLGRQILVLSRRLTKPDGGFAGVVFLSFDPQYLTGFFSDLNINNNGSFTIVGRDMVVRDMIRKNGRVAEAVGRSIADSSLPAELAAAPNGTYEGVGVLFGAKRIYSYRSLPDYPLVVLATSDRDEVLANFRERETWLLGTAMLLSVFIFAVALFLIKRLRRQARTERTLRQTQELLVESQRAARLGYVLHDVPAGLLYWSDSLVQMRGVAPRPFYTAEEAADLMDPEDRERFTRARNAALAERRGFSIDVRVNRPDGGIRWEQRVARLSYDAHGALTRELIVVQEITERKEVELELRRSRENMARAQRTAALGSFERDLRTTTTEWSDEMYKIFGYEKGKVEPGFEAIETLVHPEDRARFAANGRNAKEHVANGPIEFRIRRPDGQERIVRRESGFICDAESKPIRFYGSYQDITVRRATEARERALERQLLHSQKHEALGTMASGIAHDLNNTLVPIMALSKLETRYAPPESRLRRNLDTIFAASVQARDLVKRVLTFTRRDEIDKKDTDLRAIVDEALKLMRATIPTSIELAAELAPVPPIPLDASQIYQVVTNLITNAAHAIGNGIGTITLIVDHHASALERGAIRLSVKDTGRGMDEETRRRIFEPFFTTKAVGQGTGLGLSIIDGIVASHGGWIEVASAPGEGAQFDVYFPVAAKDTAPRNAA